MSSIHDFPAKGKILRLVDQQVVFSPTGTNYELLLGSTLKAAPTGVIQGIIRIPPRKIWTVPSGGNFISPIFGPPRVVQGRVRYLDNSVMVVQAGTPIVVNLPNDDTLYDLASGALTLNGLVNVACNPGGTFELITAK